MHGDIRCVVWDFDGVINDNIVDGRFIWADSFEADLGYSSALFQQMVFNERFLDVIRGAIDLRNHLSAWARAVDLNRPVEDILAYWFSKDAHIDQKIIRMIDASKSLGRKNVIATNNETYRASYIENEMGLGRAVDALFASGRIGIAKPDREFFQHISADLQLDPGQLLLVDDSKPNTDAARSLGWHVHHFGRSNYSALEQALSAS